MVIKVSRNKRNKVPLGVLRMFIGVSVLCESSIFVGVVEVLDSFGDCFVLLGCLDNVSTVSLELFGCHSLVVLDDVVSSLLNPVKVDFTLQSKCSTLKVIGVGDVHFVAFKVAPTIRQTLKQVVAEPVDCFGVSHRKLDNNVVVGTLASIDANFVVVNLC